MRLNEMLPVTTDGDDTSARSLLGQIQLYSRAFFALYNEMKEEWAKKRRSDTEHKYQWVGSGAMEYFDWAKTKHKNQTNDEGPTVDRIIVPNLVSKKEIVYAWMDSSQYEQMKLIEQKLEKLVSKYETIVRIWGGKQTNAS